MPDRPPERRPERLSDLPVDEVAALLRELARSPRGVWVTCAGRSMEPTIELGERVRIRACERVYAGDVVLFAGARGNVLHRVVLALPGLPWFVHLGDAGSPDGPGVADKSAVIGRADVPRQCPSMSDRLAGVVRLGRAVKRRACRPR